MAPQTLDDIRSLVRDQIPESTTLEYKSAKVLEGQDTGTIVKAVSAFANSAGGTLVIGVESKRGVPEAVAGAKLSGSKLDWLHKIIQSNSQPPIESFECQELGANDGGLVYLISINRSALAPHQASDGRYYKRRGPHSEVLEHYEIEDIRSRPKETLLPLRLDFFLPKLVVYLRIRNVSADGLVSNIQIEVDANFDLDRRAIKNLSETGMRQFSPTEERLFLLESVPTMLTLSSDPIITARASYDFRGSRVRDEVVFYARDVQDAIVKDSWGESAADKLGPRIDRLQRSIDVISRSLEQLARVSDGTGLRLSRRTLDAVLRREGSKFDPMEFDWEGYRTLLDVSSEEALLLADVFHTMGSNTAGEYEALPADLRSKFENLFDPALALAR